MANSSETWDFFICYRQATAEDFAKALKTFLEECGKRCFLDTEDIPAKFRGTEKWMDAIDQAVIECKIFVLIMTAGFDASQQVKREVTLARRIPNKLFAYFRHEDLEPDLKLILERETLDLGQQQQHGFSTENDLARKAYKILVNDKVDASLKPSIYVANRTLPTILLAPSNASVGARVKMIGAGFNPNSKMKLLVGGIELPLDTSQTNNIGNFVGNFIIPNLLPGAYTVILSDGLVNTAATVITITAP